LEFLKASTAIEESLSTQRFSQSYVAANSIAKIMAESSASKIDIVPKFEAKEPKKVPL